MRTYQVEYLDGNLESLATRFIEAKSRKAAIKEADKQAPDDREIVSILIEVTDF